MIAPGLAPYEWPGHCGEPHPIYPSLECRGTPGHVGHHWLSILALNGRLRPVTWPPRPTMTDAASSGLGEGHRSAWVTDPPAAPATRPPAPRIKRAWREGDRLHWEYEDDKPSP